MYGYLLNFLMLMEYTKKLGLDYDLILHQFCHHYSTQIAPSINELEKSFSKKFSIETTPCIQENYPTVYSQIVIRPLFESNTKKVELTLFPNPEKEIIEIQVKNINREYYLAHYEKIDFSDWGSTGFNNLLLSELYLAFFKKRSHTLSA